MLAKTGFEPGAFSYEASVVQTVKVTVVYYSRRLFVNGGVIISMYSSLTNELGVRKESEMGLILLSGDENIVYSRPWQQNSGGRMLESN